MTLDLPYGRGTPPVRRPPAGGVPNGLFLPRVAFVPEGPCVARVHEEA